MTFVTASLAVAGLIAVVIPVLIHLLWRRRRAPIEWAAMRFLLEAYHRHRRRLWVEQLLLLLTRCCIPALLGLALARPALEQVVFPAADMSRVVYIVIDDGLAAGLMMGGGGTALDRHVAAARQIIRDLDAGDRVGLITAARPAATLLSPPSTDRAAVIELLESLRPSYSPTDLPGALEQVRSALQRLEADDARTLVCLLSEFRTGSAVLEDSLPVLVDGLTAPVDFLALPPAVAAVSNLQITDLEPARSLLIPDTVEESGRITLRLLRQGGEMERHLTHVRLSGDEQTSGEVEIVEWEPGQAEASVNFFVPVAGRARREMQLTALIDDDPLQADNRRHMVLAVRRRLYIVAVDRPGFGFEPTLDRLTPGQWISRALQPSAASPIDITHVEPAVLNAGDLQIADVVILPRPDLLADAGWTALRRFVDDGGLLLISPADEAGNHRWVDHLRTDLALPWPVQREVRDYPEGMALADDPPPSGLLRHISGELAELIRPVLVYRLLPVESSAAGESFGPVPLRLRDGSPLLLAGSPAGRLPASAGDAASGTIGPSRGLVIYLATAPQLDWTNLPSKPLMVPLLHEMVRQGLSVIGGSQPIIVGDSAAPGVPAAYPAARSLIAPSGSPVGLDHSGRLTGSLGEPGLYQVVDGGMQEVGQVAVNIDPAGGRTAVQAAGAVKTWLGRSGPWKWLDSEDLGGILHRAESGSPLAGVLLVFLLAAVLLETVLARCFSHVPRAAAGGTAGGLTPTMGERASMTSLRGTS